MSTIQFKNNCLISAQAVTHKCLFSLSTYHISSAKQKSNLDKANERQISELHIWSNQFRQTYFFQTSSPAPSIKKKSFFKAARDTTE